MAEDKDEAVGLAQLDAEINELLELVQQVDDVGIARLKPQFDVGLYLFLFFRRN